jgi:hypothetical protein
VFEIVASFSRSAEPGAPGVHDVYFKIVTLHGSGCPCFLLNADGQPGAVGSVMSIADTALPGGDGVWAPGESLTGMRFRIGLTRRDAITFFVEAYGQPLP